MAVAVTIQIEGQASSPEELALALAYIDSRPEVAEFSVNESELLVSLTTVTFPWEPEPPGTVVEE